MMTDEPNFTIEQKTQLMSKLYEDFDDGSNYQEKETHILDDVFEQELSSQSRIFHETRIQCQIEKEDPNKEEEETGLPKKKRKDQNYIRALSRRFCDKLGESHPIQPQFRRTPAIIQDLRFIMVLLRLI